MADKEKKVAKTENKPQKPEKKKGRIKEAWRGFKSEVKKIVWPTWKQVLKNTAIVVGCVIAVGIFIWLFDFVAQIGIDALISVFH